MKRNLIVGAAALVLSGCGPIVLGPTLTWKNNAQYSTVEVERAARVGDECRTCDECRTWQPLATIPGSPSKFQDPLPLMGPACYRVRGCTTTGCSPYTEPSLKPH